MKVDYIAPLEGAVIDDRFYKPNALISLIYENRNKFLSGNIYVDFGNGLSCSISSVSSQGIVYEFTSLASDGIYTHASLFVSEWAVVFVVDGLDGRYIFNRELSGVYEIGPIDVNQEVVEGLREDLGEDLKDSYFTGSSSFEKKDNAIDKKSGFDNLIVGRIMKLSFLMMDEVIKADECDSRSK